MKKLAVLFLLFATTVQANPVTLICTGKTTFVGTGRTVDEFPTTAILDLDKLTFKPPWGSGALIYFHHQGHRDANLDRYKNRDA